MARLNIGDNDIFSAQGTNVRPSEEIFDQGHQSIDSSEYYPKPENFNWFWNLVTNDFQYVLRNALLPYDADETYPKGAQIYVDLIHYQSLVDDNKGNTPASSPTQWKRTNDDQDLPYASSTKKGVIRAKVEGTKLTIYLED